MQLEEDLWGLNEEKAKKYNVAINTSGDKKIYNSKEYHAWSYMLRMVYEDNSRFVKKRSGRDIGICEEWLDFANFNEWFGENFYTVDNETMDLCRNLLDQDNEIFCPDKCVFVPRRIIQLITPKNVGKSNLPRGVRHRQISDTYYSVCYIQKNGKPSTVQKSGFSTPEEAFEQYKQDKEKYIKRVAKEYQNKVPRSVYKALMEYEVRM
jgi:hypothetical protein